MVADKLRREINHSVVLTQEEQDYICQNIIYGVGITQICTDLKMPLHHVYDYAAKDPIFDKRMEKSRVYQAHTRVDELLTITKGCNSMSEVARAKVDSDNIKWSAGKFAPQRFGENINVSVSHHLDLSSILLAAENRVLPILAAKAALTNAPGATIECEVIPEPAQVATPATGINDLSTIAETFETDATLAIPQEWI